MGQRHGRRGGGQRSPVLHGSAIIDRRPTRPHIPLTQITLGQSTAALPPAHGGGTIILREYDMWFSFGPFSLVK